MTNYREIIDNILAKLKIRGLYSTYKILKIFHFEYGHLKSSNTKESVDKTEPIPWFTYPAIEYLKQLDITRKNIFEYGSGNSTRFWSRKSNKIISVEDNKIWFLKLQKTDIGNNTKIIFKQNKRDYVNSIKKYHKFDIIVIDGSHRSNCARISSNRLKKGGIIILDNSDKFPKTANILRNKGYIQIDFHGFGPINPYTWCTSFFVERTYNFKPLGKHQPRKSIGGLNVVNYT